MVDVSLGDTAACTGQLGAKRLKIFISYSQSELSEAEKIRDAVKPLKLGKIVIPDKQGIFEADPDNPFAATFLPKFGNLEEKKGANSSSSKVFASIEKQILESDLSIVIYSASYKRGAFSERELHTILTNAALNPRKQVIVFAIDHASRSFDLEQHKLVFASEDYAGGLSHLLEVLRRSERLSKLVVSDVATSEAVAHDAEELTKKIIEKLRLSFSQGSLTLVAGAGISLEAKVPDWNELLDDLLEKLVVKHIGKNSRDTNSERQDFGELKNKSSLIIGQYLKNSLQDDFLIELRSSLYKNVQKSSPIIDAICEMAKPRRAGNDLDSIITFNFDDLLEQNLNKNGILYKEIYQEGERAGSNEIPIYHVHGFLPMSGDLTSGMSVVFSEDAYHDQFIDPFSWSNLIQLSKFGQNTCVFVGLSLSDPNLRRLLDVSNRKEANVDNRHYIIQKRKDSSVRNTLIETLQEQDAAGLGLGIIWVNNYEDIPKVILEISA